jgi:hypothetical protein
VHGPARTKNFHRDRVVPPLLLPNSQLLLQQGPTVWLHALWLLLQPRQL